MGIKDAFQHINRQRLIKSLVDLKGYKKETIETAFSRGPISKKLAPDLEELTQIPVAFWLMPELYNIKGERR